MGQGYLWIWKIIYERPFLGEKHARQVKAARVDLRPVRIPTISRQVKW